MGPPDQKGEEAGDWVTLTSQEIGKSFVSGDR